MRQASTGRQRGVAYSNARRRCATPGTSPPPARALTRRRLVRDQPHVNAASLSADKRPDDAGAGRQAIDAYQDLALDRSRRWRKAPGQARRLRRLSGQGAWSRYRVAAGAPGSRLGRGSRVRLSQLASTSNGRGVRCRPRPCQNAGREMSSGRGVLRCRSRESACSSRCGSSIARACALSALRTVEPR